jgi:hypothetical protein
MIREDYVFKDSRNVFWVYGEKTCSLTGEKIDNIGFIRLTNNTYIFLSLNGVKESKKYKTTLDEYIQFYVTDKILDDFVIVNLQSAGLVDCKEISVWDIDRINKEYPSKTIDRTRFAGRENLDDTALIGSPDVDRLVELDKPIDDEGEVDALFEDVLSSDIVVDDPRLLEDKNDEK